MCDCVQKNFLEQPYGSNSYSNCVQMLTRWKGLKDQSYDTYVLNGWPQTNVVEYFFKLKHHHQQGKCRCFLPS